MKIGAIIFFRMNSSRLPGKPLLKFADKTLIEIIQNRYGNKVFKLILFLSIFYMSIFLIAEVTAVSVLIKYISGTSLWLTALIIIISSLI